MPTTPMVAPNHRTHSAAVEESSKKYLALWAKHQQLEPVLHYERYHIKVGDSKGR